MAGGHGRPTARAVRGRPAHERGMGTRHRGRVLPATREALHRDPDRAHPDPSPPPQLTGRPAAEIINPGRPMWARSGPMLLATRWSHRTGKRHKRPSRHPASEVLTHLLRRTL